MEIKILKAGTGDSILIHHKKYNIVIDGGNESKYLLSEIDEIFKNEEILNLLIITHHDDDHIKGIIDLLKHINENNYNKDIKFVEKVIFNSPRLVLGKISKNESNLLSYKQAYEVEELLIRINTEWKQYKEGESIAFEDLRIDILSPTIEDLEVYSLQNGVYLTSDNRCDWKSPMSILDKYMDDDSQDKSIPNKSSIVIRIECEDKRVLLTGDVTPERLDDIMNKLSTVNEGNPVYFDLVKLPHHGSYRSLSKNILEKISCNNYIVSTNSRKHFLPNKRALMKVLKYSNRFNNQPINFIFNYEEALNNLEITKKEMNDYNFKLTPNNKNYGISF
ncbi:MAG TPA: MBL fold metallo-hydrolase [Prolixibacteraceae bacterium]|nr:MBL fold metallo-hydrolase [Prolixibacteraceae bacterium]